MREFLKKHYHWIIAVMALLQLLIYGGALNNFSGYHMIPVTEALGISRTAFSLANSLRSVVGVFSTLFSGVLIHRLGYRRSATIGLCVAGFGYVVFSTMNSYLMLLVGSAMMGVAAGLCATSAVSRLLNGWFHKYRGTVLGLVTAATGIGSTVLGLVQTWAIENVSWRLSFMIGAALQLGLAIFVFLLVRNAPEDMGLRPYGEGQLKNKTKKSAAVRWAGPTMQQLRKRPAFYVMLACAFFSCMCVLATQYNLTPYMQDCGMSAIQTGKIYGTMMLMLGIIKLSMGALCDGIGAKRVVILCHIACAAGLALVMALPRTEAAMIGALLVYDLCIPLTTMMFPLLSVDLFGYQAQSQYIGVIMAMTSASNIVSGPLANVVRDNVGSYEPAFWGVAVLSVAMIGMYALLFLLAKRDRQKLDAET